MPPTTAAAMSRKSGPIPQIVSIQYLRAIAALAVVVFHALEATRSKFAVGAAGVDVFFVISGFIMWTLTEGAETRPGSFLWRRVIRITPPYWIATLLIGAIVTARPHFLWQPQVRPSDFALSLLFLPHLDGWGRNLPVVIQGWTLTFEMFFYVVFGAILFLPRRRQLAALTLGFAGLTALGLALPRANPIVATYCSPLLLEFLAGAFLGRLWLAGRLRNAWLGAALLACGLGGFAAEALAGVRDEGPMRVLLFGVPALATVMGALHLEGAGKVPCVRPFKTLGDASYSIYLFHVPLIALGYRLLGGAPTALRVAASVVAGALVGMVLFKLMEKPLTTALRRLPKRLRAGRHAGAAEPEAAPAVAPEPT